MFDRKYLAWATMAVALAIFLTPLAVVAQTWCAKPTGAGATAAMFQSTQALLPFVEKMTSGAKFVIIRRPSAAAMDPAAYRQAYVEGMMVQAREQDLIKEDEAEWRQAIEASAPAEFEDAKRGVALDNSDDNAEPIQLTYFYSNAPKFREAISGVGDDKGVTLEGTQAEMDAVFVGTKGKKPSFPELVRRWNVDYIFVEGVMPDASVLKDLPKATTILKLPSDRSRLEPLLRLAQNDTAGRAILFALPTTAAQGLQWGMTPHRAEQFAIHGTRTREMLRRSGARVEDIVGLTPDAVAQKVAALKAEGVEVAVLGEAADGGKGFRIPGQTVPMAILGDVAQNLHGALLLFCNSSVVTATDGVSVIGQVYTSPSRDMLMALFGALPSEPAVQTDGAGATWPTAQTIETAETWLMRRVDMTKPDWIREMVELAEGVLTVGQFEASAMAPTEPVGAAEAPVEPATLPDLRNVWLFLIGAAGGAAKEFFRWRTLVLRGRARKFLKPAYIAVTAGFVILGGLVGLLFGGLDTGALGLIFAFTAGVGLEELISRLSRLEIWNPAGVAQDDHAEEEAGPQEFLARR